MEKEKIENIEVLSKSGSSSEKSSPERDSFKDYNQEIKDLCEKSFSFHEKKADYSLSLVSIQDPLGKSEHQEQQIQELHYRTARFPEKRFNYSSQASTSNQANKTDSVYISQDKDTSSPIKKTTIIHIERPFTSPFPKKLSRGKNKFEREEKHHHNKNPSQKLKHLSNEGNKAIEPVEPVERVEREGILHRKREENEESRSTGTKNNHNKLNTNLDKEEKMQNCTSSLCSDVLSIQSIPNISHQYSDLRQNQSSVHENTNQQPNFLQGSGRGVNVNPNPKTSDRVKPFEEISYNSIRKHKHSPSETMWGNKNYNPFLQDPNKEREKKPQEKVKLNNIHQRTKHSHTNSLNLNSVNSHPDNRSANYSQTNVHIHHTHKKSPDFRNPKTNPRINQIQKKIHS